jgi:hypothetical protein
MAFLELNRRYSTGMEREAGNGRRKCRFLNKQLIGPARVFNKNKRKFVLLQNLFSSLLSKMYYFCFIYIVLFEFELTSYFNRGETIITGSNKMATAPHTHLNIYNVRKISILGSSCTSQDHIHDSSYSGGRNVNSAGSLDRLLSSSLLGVCLALVVE